MKDYIIDNSPEAEATRFAFEAMIGLSYSDFVTEQNCAAWLPTTDCGYVAIAVEIKNPNSYPRSWTDEERETAMRESATASLVRITPYGIINHLRVLKRGEKAFALWDDPDAQNDLLMKVA